MHKCTECGGSASQIIGDLVKCDYCGKLYSTASGRLSEVNLLQIYDSATVRAISQDKQALQEAVELFEALGSYKDSAMKAIECRDSIRKQKVQEEDRKLEERRQAEKEEIEREKRAHQEKKIAQIKCICMVSVVMCVVVIALIVGISSSRKRARYDEAMELYSQQRYEEALEIFKAMGQYSDSQMYVENISNLIKERENAYSQGVSYYKSGLYENAIRELGEISEYMDASEYIENASNALYQQASELFEKEEYSKAKEKLVIIPVVSNVYAQSQTLYTEIEEILNAQERAKNYELAVNYFDNEQYEMAQHLFINMGAYEDVASYLTQIGTFYYNQATDYYNQGEYAQCGEMLEHIDTASEWSEYTLATVLWQKAVEAYEEIVILNAKNICRSEGYSAMSTYIDSAICSILDASRSTRLKEECNIEVISLSEMKPYYIAYKGHIKEEKGIEDTLGNVYTYSLVSSHRDYEYDYSWTYDINKEYKYFSATIAVGKDAGSYYDGGARIYGDGNLLWSDEQIKPNTKPYQLQIDISDITDLKIELYGSNGISAYYGETILGNPTLSE